MRLFRFILTPPLITFLVCTGISFYASQHHESGHLVRGDTQGIVSVLDDLGPMLPAEFCNAVPAARSVDWNADMRVLAMLEPAAQRDTYRRREHMHERLQAWVPRPDH